MKPASAPRAFLAIFWLCGCPPAPTTSTLTVHDVPTPTIESFTVSPTALPAGGGNVTLEWAVTNTTVAFVDQGVGDVSGVFKKTVPVTTSTVFTLGAVNAKSSTTATASVTVALAPPTISSFTADRTALPYGGGSVRLEWKSAGGQLTLDGVAVEAIASSVVNATATRTFMLTATNAVDSVSATVTVDVATTTTIVGKVVYQDSPLPIVDAKVRVIGAGSVATTDAAGGFSISGIAPPYDLAFALNGSTRAFVYRGLTTVTPWVTAVGVRPPTVTATAVAGHITYVPAPAALGSSLVQWTSAKKANGYATPDPSDNYNMPAGGGPAGWYGGSYDIGALWVLGFDGGTTYYGARPNVTLAQDGSFSGLDITATPQPNLTLSGTSTIPAAYSYVTRWVGSRFEAGGGYYAPGTATPVFSVTFAKLPNAQQFIKMRAGLTGMTSVEFSETWLHGFVADAAGLSLAVDEAPLQLTPAGAATGVGYGTSFSWTPFSSGLYVLDVRPSPPDATTPSFSIITAATSDSFTDVTSLALPALQSGKSYQWQVRALAPVASVDAAASEGGSFYAILLQFEIAHKEAFSLVRSFTSGP